MGARSIALHFVGLVLIVGFQNCTGDLQSQAAKVTKGSSEVTSGLGTGRNRNILNSDSNDVEEDAPQESQAAPPPPPTGIGIVYGRDRNNSAFGFLQLTGNLVTAMHQDGGVITDHMEVFSGNFLGTGQETFVGRYRSSGSMFLLWRPPGGVLFYHNYMGGQIGANMDLVTGDFDGDGITDFLGRDRHTSNIHFYPIKNGTFAGDILTNGKVETHFKMVAGRFGNDGRYSLIGLDPQTGRMHAYFMNGPTFTGRQPIGNTRVPAHFDIYPMIYDSGQTVLLGRDLSNQGQLHVFPVQNYVIGAGSVIPAARAGANIDLFPRNH